LISSRIAKFWEKGGLDFSQALDAASVIARFAITPHKCARYSAETARKYFGEEVRV